MEIVRFILPFIIYIFVTSVFVILCLGFGFSLTKISRNKYTVLENIGKRKCNDCKYILLWSNYEDIPFKYMKEGRTVFLENQCPYNNCYVTAQHSLLGQYKNYDAIAFDVKPLTPEFLDWLPRRRNPYQKYVFTSIESPSNYPVCDKELNNYFNWTWTYKLDSDARWGYIVIRDKNYKVIGPNKNMNWIKLDDMDPVSEDLKSQLVKKTKAAAWFVSNCNTTNKREVYAKLLQVELRRYNYTLDIFGKCGTYVCVRSRQDICDLMIENDYYFYLAFENSFAEDYVTEKVITALNNYAVPVVYGGANYTRFMADGMYLNARELGVKELAKQMYELIKNPEKYYNYFRWRNHYKFTNKNDYIDTNDYCGFCAILNDKEKVTRTSTYTNLTDWWSSDLCLNKTLYPDGP